jgi:magnesium transporter
MNPTTRESEMVRRSGRHSLWFAMTVLGLSGCSEELGPERFSTATVRGVVRVGTRPVGGGWIVFDLIEGNRGNLRIARIKPDGSFLAERVPTGRVVIALDRIPVNLVPSASGPIDSRLFQMQTSPIRRTIPEGREVELPIDLIDEATRSRRKVQGSRRKRGRSGRNSNGREGNLTESDRPPTQATPPPLPRVRVIYREASGAIHLDWPADQLAQALGDSEGTVWVDVEDIESANNASVEAMLRDVFHFHALAIEDALKDTHIPKVDDWGTYLYIVVDTLDFHAQTDEVQLHELDLFLGSNFLVSYHNEATEVLERHRRHLEREPESRLKFGAAHLLYRLLDEVVAEFLPAIEHLDNEIDDAQDEVFDVPTPRTLRKIFHVKRNALRLHRVVIPMREVLNRLARDSYTQIHNDHRIYFRDVYDHLVRIHDIIESLRDLIAGALDTYLSVVSNRTNDIMKALTIVNVMFLPLTFIAGFFGMNFFGDTLMFTWPALPRTMIFWGACALMIGTPVGMAIVARRRGWI